jgi:prepilin-type N-terminal cleavage/methylation domain-containing protein
MKGRRALRRRQASGFTLMELMVVVMLVALLAMLATPSFAIARNDRAAFDYARQFQQVLARARSRAAGTGAAHLAVLGGGADSRGYMRVYAASDGATIPSPVSSCKQDAQWAEVAESKVDLTAKKAVFLEFVDMNSNGINKDMNLKTAFSSSASTDPGSLNVIVVCVSPSGTTFVGTSATAGDSGVKAAITAMQDSTAYTGWAMASIQRHDSADAPIGLAREVIITGGAAPRIYSK